MKKQYIPPAIELIYFVPSEEIASKPWEWNSGLQNYWGDTKSEVPSGSGLWYDFTNDELNP